LGRVVPDGVFIKQPWVELNSTDWWSLSQVQKSIVQKFLVKSEGGHIPTIARGQGPLQCNDFASLGPKKWLSDSVVNVFLKVMALAVSQQGENSENKVLPSFFHTQWASKDVKPLQRWFKNVDFVTVSRVIIPVVKAGHWTLLVS
jgi:Ulp1 family protease